MISIEILYILLALLVFGVLILIHELGHFLCARAFGVKINEFSVGMGPRIFGRVSKKYGTAYSLRAFPIGGYVSMDGEDGESEDENSFGKKAVWKRIIITVAGAVMNLLLGFALMFGLVFSSNELISTTVEAFREGAVSNADGAGLAVGDRIIKVGNVSVHTGNELSYEIMNQGYEAVDITVVRDGEEHVLGDIVFYSTTEQGVTFGVPDFYVELEEVNFATLLKHSFWRSVSTVKMVIDSVVDLVTGRYGMEAVSGPVGTTAVIGDAAKEGGVDFLYLVAVITINLGVMNLLPFPALDGGRLIFLFAELVTRKRLKPEIEGYINFAGLVILLGFMILITFKDIMGLI